MIWTPAPRHSAIGLAVVGLGAGTAALDTAVNIAFPSITIAFDLEVRAIQWVVIGYMLTFGSLTLAFGKLGDLFGHRRVFRIGLAVCAVAFAACAVAPSFGLLLAARVLQGVGAALTLGCGPALATALYPESGRTRALGIFGAIFAGCSALGPLIGGVLVAHWGWSAVFAFRTPLVLAALALSGLLPAARPSIPDRTFDLAGAILLACWISALLLAFTMQQWGTPIAIPAILAAAAIAAFWAFIARQRNASEPIIRMTLFRDPEFAVLNLQSVAVNLAAFAVLLLVPYYLTRVGAMAAPWAGALLAVSATGTVVGSLGAGRLGARLASRPIALAGALTCAAGLGAIGLWSPQTAPATQAATLLVQGVGLGLFQVAYADMVIAMLPTHDRGVAGRLTVVTRTIGIIAGAAGLSALFAHFHQPALAAGISEADAFLGAFRSTFAWTSLGLFAVIGASLLCRRVQV